MIRRAAILIALLAACGNDLASSSENRAREAFVQALAEREGLVDRWQLASRGELVFEDGFAPMVLVEEDLDGRWTELPRPTSFTPPPPAAGQVATRRRFPVRWLAPAAHLRVRGTADMQLRLVGRVDRTALASRPRVTVTLGGVELASELVGEDGRFTIVAFVYAPRIRDWTLATVAVSSIDPWKDPDTARVACVESISWLPAVPTPEQP